MSQPLQTLYLIGFKCYLRGNRLWCNTSVLFKVKQLVLKKSVVKMVTGNPYFIRVFLMSGIFLSHSESLVYQKGASFILIKKRCNNKKLKHKLLEQLFSL